MEPWKLKRTRQCEHCPWRVETNPYDIPHGYDVEKHRALEHTIATPGDLTALFDPTRPLAVMACHETDHAMCLGWLIHQLGDGNNIPLRLRMRGCTNVDTVRLRGAQHATFADTLPRPKESP
jgi:hypothetical protein